MSDYTMDDSPSAQQQQHGNDATLHNTSLDDQNAANNSIIGKVKSRVSSILPNSLSKWFSPSSKSANDAYNGGTRTSGNVARRRRRIEIEDDEDENYEEEDYYQGERGEYEENHNLVTKKEENSENEDDDNDDDDGDEDDESQNSEEEYNSTLAAQKVRHTTTTTIRDRQPPAKRSRLSADIRDSPLLASRQPLIASTPEIGSVSYGRTSIGSSVNSSSRSSTYQRYTNMNLYRNTGKKEPAYNFGQYQNIGSPKTNTDIIDIITKSNETSEKLLAQTNIYTRGGGGISNRRGLNIPSSTSSRIGTEHVSATTIPQLKRQPLSTSKFDLSASSSPVAVPPRRTSTTIHEVRDSEENSEHEDDFPTEINRDASKYNGQTMGGNQIAGHINGSEFNRPAGEGTLDTASESGESGSAYLTKSMLQNPQRKTGLYNTNMLAVTTRNSSRTSSFGNGLNFYSHLEGSKSLFTGQGQGDTNQMNNSTLSLTSLNRRQFNASIYGSTSALSDSRLLNTFSPFYKGKTTYGGAAAYNKYSSSSGGANAVRITPTLIRPTSSLSTLSSSSCSLSNNTHMSHQQQIGDSATISSTAKRILDLINDFATPLSDAKKMANKLKMTPSAAHLKDRLNDNDLNTSRAIRLSQVRTPYSRPSVILQPSGNANTSMRGGPQPPVKELQVPTMSQLLQMKKIQTTTEKMRTITRDNSHQMSEYTLPPIANESNKFGVKTPPATSQTKGGFIDKESQQQQQQQQQKHTNKIKNKVSNTLRATAASKDLQDEAPPPSVNLPTLAFPLMQSVPKFDIQFSSMASTNESATTVATTAATTKVPMIQTAFNTKTITSVSAANNLSSSGGGGDNISRKSANINFKFSEPLVVKKEHTHQYIEPSTSTSINYTFSPPLAVSCPSAVATKALQQEQSKPQLRTTGSCLDVFSKPFPTNESFGDKFKKSANTWECDACMVRNELAKQKCVACETPRKVTQGEVKVTTPYNALTLGQQFKKSSSEWECDTCMIRNKEESKKCVACETPRKGVPSLPPPNPTVKNTFGDEFKPKSGTWECPTCMIANKQDNTKCVACETSKPGCSSATSSSTAAAAATSTFKFGFATPQIASKTMPSADSGFQSIVAQQKAAKWECDACMTRNDSERTKCACCEQPKPGSNATNEKSSFSFGATSASKFSFGFNTAAKEEDLRKENAMNATNKTPQSFGALSGTSTASSVGGFQFGLKTTMASANAMGDKNKDEADSKNNQSLSNTPMKPAAKATVGFEINTSNNNNNNNANVSEITSTKTSMGSGFSFGNKINTTNTTSSASASGPAVNFNSPTTTTSSSTSSSTISFGVKKPSDTVGGTTNLTFGSNTSASSTTEGFSFGVAASKKETGLEKKLPLQEFAFKTPAAVSSSSSSSTTTTNSNKIFTPTTTTTTTEFVFGTNTKSTIPTTTTAAAIGNTTTTTTTSSTGGVSTAAVKPMFSFGSTAALSQGSAAAVSTTPSTGFGGFSFNNPSTSASTFGSVTSSTSSNSATTTSTSSLSTAPASTTPNIFGSFGGKSTSSPLTFSSTSAAAAAANANPANNSTTVSSSTNSSSSSSFSLSAKPTFGSFGGTTGSSTPTAASTNVFGSFGGGTSGGTSSQIPTSGQTQQNKPIASVLGNVASTKNSSNSNSSSASNNTTNTFVFGSAAAPATNTNLSSAATSTWPKNNFVFGSAATATTTNSTQSTNVSTDAPKTPALFGSFNSGTDNTSNQQATLSSSSSSIFGNANASSNLPLATPPSFGSATAVGSSAGSTNLFASANATPVSSNIFGANHSGNAVTPAPAFGSSPFGGGGGSASSTSAIPTFGSTAAMSASTTSFGGFGAPPSKTTNGPEAKKSEAAFSFGSANQTPSGGFNFSSSSAKPAFNFGSTSATQATFNFTGTTESQNSTKPFEFGAIPSAPAFNFGGGNAAIETTPNAPFQFNAGSVPVSSNIFAPAPTPGTQTAQQAKRKIRAPLKRVTQR